MSARITADGLHKKKKGPAPAHQNKFAFHHNPNSSQTAKIESIPNVGLCQKCTDIIEWKKQYRKYKARSVLGRCVQCDEKKIKYAYHIICQDCAAKSKTCAKCRLPAEIVEDERMLATMSVTEDEALTKLRASGLRERERRTILRDLERGDVTPSEIVAALDGKIDVSNGADESSDEDEEEFDEDDVDEEQ